MKHSSCKAELVTIGEYAFENLPDFLVFSKVIMHTQKKMKLAIRSVCEAVKVRSPAGSCNSEQNSQRARVKSGFHS